MIAGYIAGPSLAAYGVDPVFKSGSDLYNADLDDEADTVSFYNCSTLGYNATYNIANTDSSVSVRACNLCCNALSLLIELYAIMSAVPRLMQFCTYICMKKHLGVQCNPDDSQSCSYTYAHA